MSAIITETFRRNNTKAFLADISDVSNRYYVGIGKSDAWPDAGVYAEDDSNYVVADPIGTSGDNVEVLNNLTTLVGITTGLYTQVIPNIAAKTNHKHKAYNPFDPNCFYQTSVLGVQMYPCYVIVNDNVYLCLREADGILPSYSLPNGSNPPSRIPQENADGSVWIYVYSVLPAYAINGSQFVTVTEDPTFNGVETLSTITNASGNLVYGFTVIDGGSGYAVAPTVEYIDEDGASTTLLATVADGAITSVTYTALTTPLTWIKKRGYVKVASGTARVYANIGPALGFGAVPASDLPSWYAGITVEAVEGINDGAFIPYRQVSIVRNPDYTGGVLNPELSLNCLEKMTFSSAPEPTSASTGDTITQVATGAIGIVDYYDEVNKYLYYHQTAETGFIAFDDTPIAIGLDPYDPSAVSTGEYVKQTGEVVFTENRKKISRIAGQSEDITIILQF
jgi:hypothetical protein